MKNIVRPLVTAIALISGCLFCLTQQISAKPNPANYVKIQINSGNPTFPYPQFLEYRAGRTLATDNSEGVTHADMEKTGREAYEIMSHRCRYDGGTHCGVPYITFNNFPKFDDLPHGGAEFCSEGDGYMLLAAAVFADQPTFNGLWMWIHDNRLSKVIKYKDGQGLRMDQSSCPGYLPGWKCDEDTPADHSNTHSAVDGDVDIAMALLIAHKQWGDYMYQDGQLVKDFNGNPISYKEAAQNFIKSMVDTVVADRMWDGSVSYYCGDIGVDGYLRGGNTIGELSGWRTQQNEWPELKTLPYVGGTVSNCDKTFYDYHAPSYFNEFAYWLEHGDGEGTPWEINQFKRAEASSDWIMGQAYEQGLIPSLGTMCMDANNNIEFHNSGNGGEDFRASWRTILNYLWHGNPTTTWNPVTHHVEEGGNTFEYDMAYRYAEFLRRPKFKAGNSDGSPLTDCGLLGGGGQDKGQPRSWGVSHIVQCYNKDGSIQHDALSNYVYGAASPAIVAREDHELLGDMYRQSELVWDGADQDISTNEEKYILNMPKYFHGMYRVLGLLVNSGNWHAPRDMVSASNMKVYMAVNKTYVYQDDDLEYTVSFRNYGSADAENVVIETDFNPNYELVSLDSRGKLEGNKIVWNIGTVPGFKTGHLEATVDSVKFKVIVRGTDDPRICLKSKIFENGVEKWISNEYPNHATYTMERNCVDILTNRTLSLKKSANRTSLNPNDQVKFTLEFENKSEGEKSWLNGGRDNVRVSYGWYINSDKYVKGFRFWHDAPEACIDLSNYRFSYFMYDPSAVGLYDENDNPTGWTFTNENENDQKKYGIDEITYAHQKLPYGVDPETGKKWNQRFMIRFPKTIMPATTHVFAKIATKNEGEKNPSNFYLMHHGDVCGPPFIRVNMHMNPDKKDNNLLERLLDDWSFDESTKMPNYDGQESFLTIVTPCYADVNNLGYPLTSVMRHSCDELPVATFNRVLVEEFDGYTWRRVQGEGPLPGREAYDVTILDTIPDELEFLRWTDSTALKDDYGERIQAEFISPEVSGTKSGVIKWSTPVMMVGEKDKLAYICVARDMGCPDVDDIHYKNVAWISSKTDSPDSSQVELTTTCLELPPLADPTNSLFKYADKSFAEEGESVSYKVKYVNTTGTKVDANCKSTEEWIAFEGCSLPKVADQGFNLSAQGKYMYAPEKSFGKNGFVEFQISNGPSNTDNIWIILRYKKGIPGTSSFEGVALKMNINDSQNRYFGYELYDNGNRIAFAEGEADPILTGNCVSPVFRLAMQGDTLILQSNDEEDEWTNAPIESWTGISASGPGYFGVYSGYNNGTIQLTEFITELDYAFDITLYDDVPTELEGITNISDNGKYDDATRRITWPTQATTKETALPFGDSIVVTFDATVDNCKKFINNYALATVYGRDTLKQLNTISCGKVCELTSAKMLTTECACDSALIQVKAEAEGSYYYTFYKKGETAPVLKNSKKNSLYVKEKGDYYAVVTNMSDEECSLNSDTVAVDFSVTPEGEDYLIGNICLGTKAEDNEVYAKAVADLKALQNQDVKVVWLNEFDEEVDMPNPDLLPAGAYNYTYKLTSPTCSCESDPYQFTFTKADTAALDLKDLTICSGQSGTLSVEEMVGYTYLWSDGSTDHELMTAQEGTYSVTVTTPENCVSRAKATITVSEELLVDLGKDTTICSADLPFILDATTNYDSYEWTDGSTASTFEVTETGDYEVKVKQGSCPGSGKISVTVNETPKVIGTSFTVTYLVSDTVAGGVFDKSITQYDPTVIEKNDLYTYVWYGTDGILPLSEEPTPVVPSEGNSEKIYYVKAVNGKCESPLQQIVVKVINSPMPSAEDVNYCLIGDAKPLEAEPTGEGDWDLTWYDVDGVTKLPAAPTPSTDEVGAKIYYVTQTDRSSGEESAKKNVTVTVHALPELATEYDKKQSCNVPILLNPLFSEKSGIENYYVRYFDTDDIDMYDSQSCIDCSGDVSATKSGTYTALAYYYPVSGLKCSAVDKTPIEIIIDKVDEVKIDAPETVCPFSTIELTASVTGEFSKVDYEWNGAAMSDEANVSLVDKFGKGKEYTFQLSYNAGACLGDTTIKVTVGRGSLTGALYANDKKTKEYRSCGDESVQLSTDHEGENFVWTTYDGDPVGTGRTVLVNPTTTTTYVVTFTNKCETSDTIVVGFSPFSLQPEVDQLNASICEGESAAGKLILNGYDPSVEGAYIKWFKDGVELPEYAGMEQLSIPTADKAKDAGVYTFEAHNGFCLATNLTGVTSATLQVKPYVSFSKTESVTAIYGSDAQLSMNDLNPTDATVTWKGDQHNGEGNSYIVTAVSADELFKVHIAADNYCERDTVLQLLVDAKVDVTASTEKSVICLNDDAVIVADTSNTKGTVRNPADYKINWYACEEGGDCQLLSSAVALSITQQPTANTSYYVEVVYGEQIVSSEKIAVTVVQPLPYTKQEAVSCSGEEVEVKVTVEASSDYEVTWEDGTVGESITVAPEENTAYKFTITQNGICPISDQVEVKVKENPAITMGDEMIVCEGKGFKVEPKVTGDDIISYVWTDPNGTQVGEENALQVDSALNGQYMLKVKSESCGEAEASQKIQVSPLPILSVDSMSFTERVLSAEGNAPFEYKVDNGNWSIENSYTNLSYNMLHTAYARDVNGCVGILTFTMVQPPIAIPEYFTPDNGNVHDTWDVTTILQAYPNAEVTIYDRFGKVVAKLKGETSEWDGTYNGKPLPSTDYWYKLNVPEIDRVFTGHFTLLRGN